MVESMLVVVMGEAPIGVEVEEVELVIQVPLLGIMVVEAVVVVITLMMVLQVVLELSLYMNTKDKTNNK